LDTISNSFTGSYSYTLDAKGRINIPAKMRKALGPSNDSTFVATRGADRCVILYPLEVWHAQTEAKLLKLNKGRAINRHFTRNLMRHAETLQYDGQGRIPIPVALVEYAGVEKDVEIVGMIDRIEIWNPKVLDEHETQFEDREEDLESIADEIDVY
jgi:MraZ protein